MVNSSRARVAAQRCGKNGGTHVIISRTTHLTTGEYKTRNALRREEIFHNILYLLGHISVITEWIFVRTPAVKGLIYPL
ncbi:hypothetical protein CI610_03283 [invertebrate metagenome]|uniref:Uncharacterized protein n=1 Tax=invertebrate metagenome TaxID=1711999 RepID=A0A2H9T3H8_9ZZZZ